MPEDKLRKIADCLEEEAFDDGQCIIKQVKTLSFIEITTKIFGSFSIKNVLTVIKNTVLK